MALEVHDELQQAIGAAAARLGPGGAPVLLGTFGMDEGPALALRALGDPGEPERFPQPTL